MPLTLEVVGAKAAQMGSAARKTFHASGTIGRLQENDWVFPDEYISGRHARVSLTNGVFMIEDISTNGVFINSPQNRLVRGQRYALRDGDCIFIDDYELRVTLSEAAAAGVYSTQSAPPLLSDDPFFIDGPQSSGSSSDTDPLKLLGLESKPSRAPGPRAAELERGSPLVQHYRPPPLPRQPTLPMEDPPVDPMGIIPDDYDPMGFDDVGTGAAASVPERRPSPAPASVPRPRPGARPAPGASPAAAKPSPRPVARIAPAHFPSPGAASKAGRPLLNDDASGERRAQPERRTASDGKGDVNFAALLEGAGIDAARVSPEMSEQFGKILQVVVAGLMDVLRARDQIKDEFRLRVTTFKPQDNNPLKFSANVEDALHNLLVKRNPAYLGPVEAFEDAFQDVRNHQMAMLAGVRLGYEAMLAEFEPQRLQTEFDAKAKGGFLAGSAKQKYWDLYRKKFHDTVKDADSSFRQLFGNDFAKAYEEQLAKLKAAKKSERT